MGFFLYDFLVSHVSLTYHMLYLVHRYILEKEYLGFRVQSGVEQRSVPRNLVCIGEYIPPKVLSLKTDQCRCLIGAGEC